MNSTPVASGARKVAMGRAFSIIPFLSFAEPHAGTSAVFVDELDASGLEGESYLCGRLVAAT
jgi:hypothetical protein